MPAKRSNKAQKKTALELRAERLGWDSAMWQYRASKAQALRILGSHYKETMPPESSRILQRAAWLLMGNVWRDCTSLDDALGLRNEPPFFRQNLVSFHDTATLEALDLVVRIDWQRPREDKSPRYVAMRDSLTSGDNGEAKLKNTLHCFRELLRDQWIPDIAVQIMGPISDAETALGIGRIIAEFKRRPEKFQRSVSEWIVRGWLTLRLYELPPNGYEAYQRAMLAADLLGIPFVSERQFLTAWRNVRSRVFGDANPFFSQSAAAD